jgi:hypothetical protein
LAPLLTHLCTEVRQVTLRAVERELEEAEKIVRHQLWVK